MTTLKNYAEELIAHQNSNPSSGRRPQPEGINTLWIPAYSGNRTATINLNHQINGFGESGDLWGENGNCMTPYLIIEIPAWFNESHLFFAALKVCEILKKESGYPVVRVLKSDRVDIIKKVISDMNESSKVDGDIYGATF